MALIKTLKNFTPKFGNNVFLAENATIIGDVEIDDYTSIWYQTVIRGDVNSIRIGKKVNIQDGTIIHCTYQKAATVIGDNVSVGHKAIIHGCNIQNNVLAGMGCIIMDQAEIGENSIIAAGAVVTENTKVEAGSVFAGVPAKKIKNVDEIQTRDMIEKIANNYVMYAGWYKE